MLDLDKELFELVLVVDLRMVPLRAFLKKVLREGIGLFEEIDCDLFQQFYSGTYSLVSISSEILLYKTFYVKQNEMAKNS